MKTYHLEHLGDLDGLVMRDQEVPTPGPHEVLVCIYAVSLNRRDLRILNRSYPLPSRPGVIPVSDGAGEVVAVGAQVTRAAVGDRVAGSYFARWKEGKITGDQMTQQLGCTLDSPGFPSTSLITLLHASGLRSLLRCALLIQG
jgi:NADPH:quinone reductase-like Zn-dependent oxidoreductase